LITDKIDNVIDLVEERLKRGVSTERLLNNQETRDICKAVVYLRKDNVELLRHIIGGRNEDESLKL
tara:strand:- start:232 stop:429 length:198 start_codon:yes stop_codon:yes gene_type:complete